MLKRCPTARDRCAARTGAASGGVEGEARGSSLGACTS
jgi:hypothetical protein